jgi:hypothetical protein
MPFIQFFVGGGAAAVVGIKIGPWMITVCGGRSQTALFGPWGPESRPMRQLFPGGLRDRQVNFFENGLQTMVRASSSAF